MPPDGRCPRPSCFLSSFMKNLFLVGFMGCGKSTVGRAVATLRACGFVDLDDQIESREKMEISRIFEERGEPHFREIETRVLTTLDLSPPKVVALGGGTFTFPRNIEFVKRQGVSLFLDCPLDLLRARCETFQHRPLFLRDPVKLADLFYARLPFYRCADYRVEVSDAPPEDVARKIVNLLEKI
jgi:shikimate kinase